MENNNCFASVKANGQLVKFAPVNIIFSVGVVVVIEENLEIEIFDVTFNGSVDPRVEMERVTVIIPLEVEVTEGGCFV